MIVTVVQKGKPLVNQMAIVLLFETYLLAFLL